MKRISIFLSLIALFLVTGISALGNASTQTLSVKVPLALSDFIPCANGGNGEVVDFSGTLHEVLSSTINGNHIHINELFNPQEAKGVGETTGEVWNANGETRQDLNASLVSLPFETTFVNNFKLINGNEGSFIIHENSHITVSANGAITASTDNFTISCR